MKKHIPLPKVLTKQHFKKPIYTYWTFWLIVLLLTIITFYTHIRIITWGNMAEMRIQTQQLQEMQQAYKAYQEKVLAELKADTYGGKTPEETLRLFVEALEKGDYDLASRYVIYNERDAFIRDVHNPLAKDGINRLIRAYRYGTISVKDNDGYYEFIITPKHADIGFHVYAQFNDQSQIWKLSNI